MRHAIWLLAVEEMWPPSRGTPLAASGGRSRRARFEGQRATDDPMCGKGRTGQVTRQGCWHQLKTETASLGRADSAGGMLRDHQRRRRRTCDDADPRRVTWDADRGASHGMRTRGAPRGMRTRGASRGMRIRGAPRGMRTHNAPRGLTRACAEASSVGVWKVKSC